MRQNLSHQQSTMSAPSERAPLLSSAATSASKTASPGVNTSHRTPTMRGLIRLLPPSVVGLALGVCGLGITWQTAADYLAAAQSARIMADVISLASFNIGATLLLLYISKIVLCFPAVVEDLRTSDGNSVLPCMDMALMTIAWWLDIHGFHSVGQVIWTIAVIIHCALLALFVRFFLARDLDPVTPGWMIPAVGIAMAAGTGAAIGMGAWVSVFFWFALVCFVVLFPVCLYRVHVHPSPVLDHHQPLYAVLAAPAALLLTSWIAMGGHQGHELTHFLFLVEMVSVVLVALRLPQLAPLPFTPAVAAYTFPADISAKASILYTHLYLTHSAVMVLCSWFFVLVASTAVGVTLARFASAGVEAVAAENQRLQDPDSQL